MISKFFTIFLLSINLVANNAYKITREAAPIPALKNAALEYKGPVFLIKETNDVNAPFVGLIVDGGIEMVRPNPNPISLPFTKLNAAANESVPEIQEDPEYFAVLVTPETVAQAQISRTTTITLPLTVLLAGVSAKMPWLMVLKKQNHFDYFRTLITLPLPINIPQRRRYKRATVLEQGRLFSENKKYPMIYSEDDKLMLEGICNSIMRELMTFSDMLAKHTNNYPGFQDSYDGEKLFKPIAVENEFAIGTDLKFSKKP